MEFRSLGHSGLRVSSISFGAGPISGLMVGEDHEAQRRTVHKAVEAGINWFDTAASYANGDSERSLGAALRAIHGAGRFHIATKVRLLPRELDGIESAVSASVEQSLARLGAERVSLLQLHNSVTTKRGDLPTSVAVRDVLGKNGVVAAFERLREQRLVDHFGFTGLGDTVSLDAVIDSQAFTSVQVPLSLLTQFSDQDRSAGSIDVDYEKLIEKCAVSHIGVIAIRVFAGGALSGQEPSPHTQKTRFFTLDLFERDRQRSERLAKALPNGLSLSEATIRFVLGKPGVATALIGFGNVSQVEEAVAAEGRGRLDKEILRGMKGSLKTG